MSRTLSCFFAREFFWAHLEGKLDKVRTLQLEEHLKECHACTDLLERERVSRKILQDLSSTQPTAEVVAYIQREHHFWDDFFEGLGLANSMETIRWVAQLSVVGVALVITVHFFPWLNLARSLRNMRPSTTRMAPEKKEAPPLKNSDEDVALGPSNPPPSSEKPSPSPSAPFIGPRLPTPEELATMAEKKKALEAKAESEEKDENDNESEAEETAGIEAPESGNTRQAGFVWRGSLKVDELSDEVAERVTQFITDLGGSKAGHVELGWHRGSEFYYHFILPEENYDKLLNQLNEEGLVQLVKERHPRVMKSGYMRIIMTVEQDEAETH